MEAILDLRCTELGHCKGGMGGHCDEKRVEMLT